MAGMRNNPSSNFGNDSQGPSKKPEYVSEAARVEERANQRENITRDAKDKLREFKRNELSTRLKEAEKEADRLRSITNDIDVLKDLAKDMDSGREAALSIVANMPKDSEVASEDILLLLGALGRKDNLQFVEVLNYMSVKVESNLKKLDEEIEVLEKEVVDFKFPMPEKKTEETAGDAPEETVEEVKVDPERAIRYFMNRIQSGMKVDVSPGTDGLNRIQNMRFVYAGENVDGNSINGDQIFLQKAIEEVGASVRFRTSNEDLKAMIDNMDKLTDRQAINILGAYQQVKGLKVDGKFGPDTFNALREDLGVKIINRSNGEYVDKYEG